MLNMGGGKIDEKNNLPLPKTTRLLKTSLKIYSYEKGNF